MFSESFKYSLFMDDEIYKMWVHLELELITNFSYRSVNILNFVLLHLLLKFHIRSVYYVYNIARHSTVLVLSTDFEAL
jgi:hypothetical protein